jgi:phosphoglucomutase
MNYKERFQEWLEPPFDEVTIKATKSLIENKDQLEDSFYKNLEFGTGGMRGLMGPGTNRINKYTLGKNTQGISNYLTKIFKNNISVVIAYDCRHNSKELAKVVADVFSANNIKVYLFSDLRPTPELSFALKYLSQGCLFALARIHIARQKVPGKVKITAQIADFQQIEPTQQF